MNTSIKDKQSGMVNSKKEVGIIDLGMVGIASSGLAKRNSQKERQ